MVKEFFKPLKLEQGYW